MNHHGTVRTAAAGAGDAYEQAAAADRPDPPTAEPAEWEGDRTAIDAFLSWWQLEYPAHNHGALNVPTFSTAGFVVAELLQLRSVAELQTLAVALWTDRDDAWIFATDRSVFVLKHRADYLDRRVRAAAAAAAKAAQTPDLLEQWGYCFHSPKCTDSDVCRELRAAKRDQP